MRVTFNSEYHELTKTIETAPEKLLVKEPMLFGADLNFAIENGGFLTHSVLSAIQSQIILPENIIIDTKSVMLMPGMYPCIPGWHCDDVPRRGPNNQPNLDLINEGHSHLICVIGSHKDIPSTEFLDYSPTINVNTEKVWESVDNKVDNSRVVKTELGTIYDFSRSTLHRGPLSRVSGWRFFFRLSVSDKRPVNQIRKQVQVYLDKVNSGW